MFDIELEKEKVVVYMHTSARLVRLPLALASAATIHNICIFPNQIIPPTGFILENGIDHPRDAF